MNQEYNEKRYEARRYYVPKGIIKHYNVNGKNFYDQLNDCGIKQYKEIRKLTTGQGGDYTAHFLLDYEYLKSYDKSSWFKCTKRHRCWSKINSSNRIHWTIILRTR